MLRKLVKHELRATSRVMLPTFLVVIVLAICSNFSVRLFGNANSSFLNIIAAIILTAFGLSLFALIIIALVMMVNRFRTNFMGDEGYIMFTLPASVHQLVWSKIIVSTLWFAATLVVELLAAVFMVFDVNFLGDFWSGLTDLFRELTTYYTLNGAAILAEFLVLLFVSCAAMCLVFYASMAVGYSFDRHKLALSVVFFFLFNFLTQVIGSMSLLSLDHVNWTFSSAMAGVHTMMWSSIAAMIVYGAIFYVITVVVLKRRLNLE